MSGPAYAAIADAAAKASSAATRLRVMFVCTGNICRSPTGEAVLRCLVDRAGLAAHVDVISSGTHGYHVGDPPDPRAIKAAEAKGYRGIAAQRARHLGRADLASSHLVFAMDASHIAHIRSLAAGDASLLGKTFLLLDAIPSGPLGRDIEGAPDPQVATRYL